MATVSKWTPFGVALDITATGSSVTRKSATQFTVNIKVSWETYYSGAKTNYGMSVSSGGVSNKIISSFGTSRSSGSGSFTGTYSISGNGSATKTITVTFRNYEEDWQGNITESATKNVSFNVTVPALTSYTVKYNANGGSGAPANQTKWKDQALTLSSTKPTRTGYTFVGWGSSATSTTPVNQPGGTYTGNANYTYYAIWKANTYTVKYNANGGSGAPANQTKTYGKTLTLSSVIPTRTSVDDNGTLTTYTFKGWATSSTSTSVAYQAGANYTANSAVTLYAVWSRTVSTSTFDVSYNTNGGSEVISQIKINGEPLVLRNTIPVKNGYTFAGWGLSANSTTVSYHAGGNYTLDEDIVLYAIWTPWSHTVVFDTNGGISEGIIEYLTDELDSYLTDEFDNSLVTVVGELPESLIATTGMDNIIIPDCLLTNGNYVFKYWSTTPSGSGGEKYYAGDGYTGIKNGGTVTLYAIWDEPNIYLYSNGRCKAGEFIEGDYCGFNKDGTVRYVQFIEGSPSIYFNSTAFYATELLERVTMYLTDETDAYLMDESENYLTTII